MTQSTDGLGIGRIVHYVSYGTPGREFPSTCRAAVVTQVHDDGDTIGLAVLNPTGLFFDPAIPYSDTERNGGTWHWPERA